jgi:hypothetical protein
LVGSKHFFMKMALMEPMCNMRKGVTLNTAPGIPTAVRDYCHLRAAVVMIYKNSCCFLLHFSALTSLITHVTPFIIPERLVAKVWFHEEGKFGQKYEEIKANFALHGCCSKARQISTVVKVKSFTESEIPATTCHVTPLSLPLTTSRCLACLTY